jgi:serine/threonine-protein kinase
VVTISEWLRVGFVVGDKYRVERVLGSGGMGVVVAANHVLLNRSVAIKLVLPGAANREQLSARLLREARAAAMLQGKHAVRVLDVDRLADGTHYLVMERLVGRTLRSLLDEANRLSWQVATEYALEVCEALADAHAVGIVHRDIKPANLYLAGEPGARCTVRLLDFGACRTSPSGADPSLSAPADQGFVGSPPYVSPEQLASPSDVDPRTDIWSLGVVLYECLTGRVPFRAHTLSRLWHAILLDPVPSFECGLGAPADLERIVRRCLEKDPNARFPSARALARALGRLRASQPRARRPRAPDRPASDSHGDTGAGVSRKVAACGDLPRP